MTAFANTFSGPQGLLLAAALIVFFIVRQFSTRRLFSAWNLISPVALLYFGVQGLDQLDSTRWLVLGFGLTLAIVFGILRGITFRVWVDAKGQVLMRGTPLTLVLWIATIAAKVLIVFAEIKLGFGTVGSSSAESLLPAAVTIGTQILVVYLRGQDAVARERSLVQSRIV